jgi:hypothetical protein
MSAPAVITTKAATYEERKQQYIQLGYRIEKEQVMAVNGLCSFVAVKEDPLPGLFE